MKTVDKYMYILGATIVLGFFILLGILIFKAIPEPNKDMINLVIGTLLGAFMAVVTYFYGSSKGSKDKTDMLNQTKP